MKLRIIFLNYTEKIKLYVARRTVSIRRVSGLGPSNIPNFDFPPRDEPPGSPPPIDDDANANLGQDSTSPHPLYA